MHRTAKNSLKAEQKRKGHYKGEHYSQKGKNEPNGKAYVYPRKK
jgi:hypothetical protein